VFKTYKTSYRNKIPWNYILEEPFYNWLLTFQNATNCSINLTMGCLLSLIPSITGPNTLIQSNDASFQSPLNTYLVAVCDPGGGKTNTFNHVLEPVYQYFLEKKQIPLNIETYTVPGIQKHQTDTDGYGMISCDEGSRVFNLWKGKQQKGENDVPFLCKLWSGKGDSSTLSTGNRGFEKTSMSMFLAIQPEPLMQHIHHFNANDGFLDRFLFISAKPFMATSAITKDYHQRLMQEKMHNFVDCCGYILSFHEKEHRHYSLSPAAQTEYDHIVDSFAISLKRKYASDSGLLC
jgi:hypothetical protein